MVISPSRPGKNIYFPAIWARFPSRMADFPHVFLYFFLKITKSLSKSQNFPQNHKISWQWDSPLPGVFYLSPPPPHPKIIQQIHKGDCRPHILPHLMAWSAMGLKLGFFRFLPTTHAKTKAKSMCLQSLHLMQYFMCALSSWTDCSQGAQIGGLQVFAAHTRKKQTLDPHATFYACCIFMHR